MKIVFLKKHFIWGGILWLSTLIFSLLVEVEVRDAGGWEGEYYATYGFPFPVATRSYDMWIPFLKQFDLIYSGILFNVVFTAILTIGMATLLLFILQRREKRS